MTVVLETWDNGLTVLIEPVPDVESAAMALAIPAGAAYEPAGRNGIAAATCDWLFRGAGDYDNRELTTALDKLGVQRDESVSARAIAMRASFVASRLPEVLSLYSTIVRQPTFDEDEFEPVKASLESSLLANEDDYRHKSTIELVRLCFPEPLHRPVDGSLAELEEVTAERVRAFAREQVSPHGAVLAIAGCVDPAETLRLLRPMFGAWTGPAVAALPKPPAPAAGRRHVEQEATQTHIAMAFPSVPYSHEDFFVSYLVADVLGGGMSSRLFTEVREHRGLCYSVGARVQTLEHLACIVCQAATTNDRAAETLTVLEAELDRLSAGVGEQELSRARARSKSTLILAQESTSARAAMLVSNWEQRGRVVPVEELRAAIDGVTPSAVAEYFEKFPTVERSVLTLGPQPLEN